MISSHWQSFLLKNVFGAGHFTQEPYFSPAKGRHGTNRMRSNTEFFLLFLLVSTSILPSTVLTPSSVGTVVFLITIAATVIIFITVYEGEIEIIYAPKIIASALLLIGLIFFHTITQGAAGRPQYFYFFYSGMILLVFMLIYPNYFDFDLFATVFCCVGTIVVIIGFITLPYGEFEFLWFTIPNWGSRFYSIFSGSPNQTGRFLAIVVILSLYKLHQTRKIVFLLILSTTVPALYLTQSRGGVLMMVTGVTVYLLLTYKPLRESYSFLSQLSYLMWIGVILLIMQQIPWPGPIENIDWSNRDRIWEASVEAVADSNRQLVGMGYAHEQPEIIQSYVRGEDDVGSYTTHSGYVNIYLRNGLIGLGIFAYIIHRVVVRAVADKNSIPALALIAAYLAHLAVGGSIIATGYYGATLYFALGTVLRNNVQH